MDLPRIKNVQHTYRKFSLLEKSILFVFIGLIVIATASLAGDLQARISETVPAAGGSYTEGVVGFPRYVNPVLASTDADRDLSALVYAGLTRLGEDGEPNLDLASEVSLSEDGLTYTFKIREDAIFHDGHPVTADDVIYTIEMIKSPRVGSPRRAEWSGVNVEKIDDKTVRFLLSDSFRGFLHNTNIGILPEHLWSNESTQSFSFSDLNTNPIGAGPYQIDNLNRDDEGVPTAYKLASFSGYHNEPYIDTIRMKFYTDKTARREAFASGDIEGMYGVDPDYAKELEQAGQQVTTHPLNRIFALFFNQNQKQALVEPEVRQALSVAVPKQKIVNDALFSYGTVIDSPLPPEEVTTPTATKSTTTENSDQERAGELLTAAGWELTDGQRVNDGTRLSLTITVADIPALNTAASLIANQWKDLGIAVSVETMSVNDLSREMIRTREYEVLLFGQAFSNARDLYPFWHSSQQSDPGLNFAMYTNTQADELLVDMRETTEQEQYEELRDQFLSTLAEDQPAAFLYSPAFIYVVPEKLEQTDLPPLSLPKDRFATISNWYADTDLLWRIFTNNQEDES